MVRAGDLKEVKQEQCKEHLQCKQCQPSMGGSESGPLASGSVA